MGQRGGVEVPFTRYQGPGICWLVLVLWSVMAPAPSCYVAFVFSLPFAFVLCWRLVRDAFSGGA